VEVGTVDNAPFRCIYNGKVSSFSIWCKLITVEQFQEVGFVKPAALMQFTSSILKPLGSTVADVDDVSWRMGLPPPIALAKSSIIVNLMAIDDNL
jgi:hypothetical protein